MKQLDQLWSKVAGTEICLESLYWPPFERKTSKTIFSWKFKRSGFDMDISSSTVTQLSGRNPAVLQCRLSSPSGTGPSPCTPDVEVDGQNFRVRGPAPALINDANETKRR